MIEANNCYNKLIRTFPPLLGDDSIVIKGHKDRPIHLHILNYLPINYLYRQKAYLEFHPCDQSCKIGRNTQKYMSHDIFNSFHSYILKSMRLLEDTIESLNDSPFLIESTEGSTATEGSHHILDLIVFFEIEDRSVSGFPADWTKETLFGFLFVESAAEFESLSFGFSPPVAQLKSSFAGVFPILSDDDISSLYRVFSTPWVFCNYRGDIIFDQVAFVFCGVISCICDYGIDLFIYPLEVFFGFFGEFFEEFSVPFISWGDFNREGDRQFCISDLEMDLVAKEAEVFAFVTPGSIWIGFFGFYVGGINGEVEILFLDEAEGLGNEVCNNLGEGFLAESFSEVVEGVVVGGISIGESTEVGESSVVAEFSCKLPFGGGVAKVYEEDGF